MRTLIAATAILLATPFAAVAQSPSPAVLNDLAPTGKLRAAINFGNGVLAQKGPNGEPRGVSVALAYKLGERLGVPVELIHLQAAGKSFEALASGMADVGFIAIEPARAAEIEFTPPYVLIEGTYMVRKDSPLKDVGDVDKPGIKIGVGLASVYDIYLTRTLKNAMLVRAKVGGAAAGIPIFIDEKLDAAAGVRQPLDDFAKEHPEYRVMKGAFQEIRQAMGTPKGRTAGLAYLRRFTEDMKANGFVKDSLKLSGQGEVAVAPAEK